ncbi:hypothetical protein [Sphingomonas sp. KR3-1]|uniref:hypothetical protein n=1 Tax=Sphingomonas sp. KR3-1 TaxID=3156611 RepID=UPI0032B5A7F9
MKISIDDEGDLAVTLDVSLKGKLTYTNLADIIDWWSVTTGELDKFLDAEEAKAGTVAKAPAAEKK